MTQKQGNEKDSSRVVLYTLALMEKKSFLLVENERNMEDNENLMKNCGTKVWLEKEEFECVEREKKTKMD